MNMMSFARCTERLFPVLLGALLLFAPAAGQSTQAADTDKAIRHLMDYVARSNLTFIRNASTYTSAEAAEHMNNKYLHFKEDIKTAEDFIELCATRSMLSGKPYFIIDKEGNRIRTSEWLKSELAAYRDQRQ